MHLRTTIHRCEILRFLTGVIYVFVLVVHDAVSLGDWCTTFRDSVWSQLKMLIGYLNLEGEATEVSRNVGRCHPMTRRHDQLNGNYSKGSQVPGDNILCGDI